MREKTPIVCGTCAQDVTVEGQWLICRGHYVARIDELEAEVARRGEGVECHAARPGEQTYECSVHDGHKGCPACRLRIAEAEVARLRDLADDFRDASGLMNNGDPGGVEPRHVRDDIRKRDMELSARQFTAMDLRRIIFRVSRRPRNGQDITIEAKARAALTPPPAEPSDD